MATTLPRAEPSYYGPAFEDAKVYDAMNVGVVTCRPETSLADVARMMTGYGMHAVVIADVEDGKRAWGIVTSLDLARAGEDVRTLNAGDVATTDVLTIDSDEPLRAAAKLMAEHRVNHLVAVQPGTDRPAGMISAGGIAAAIAFGRG